MMTNELNTHAPDFALPNFDGVPFRLSDLLEKVQGPAGLQPRFYLTILPDGTWRSCARTITEFVKRQAQVLVVGPEDARAFEAYWREHDLPFIGLPDPKASVLKLYGQEVNLFKLGRMPAQVIVDKAGMARFVHYGHSMSDIPENAEVLALLDQLSG